MTMEFLPKGLTTAAMGDRCYTCGDPYRKNTAAFAAAAFEDFLGRVEICERCIRKAAQKLNMVEGERHAKVKETNQRLIKDKETLLEEVSLLREARAVDQKTHESEVGRLKVQVEKAKAGAK